MGRRILTGAVPKPGKGFYIRFGLYGAILSASLLGYWASPIKLVYNYTPSEELGWYLLKEIDESHPISGDKLYWVEYRCPILTESGCIYDSFLSLKNGMHLIKRAQALPGDIVYSRYEQDVLHNYVDQQGSVKDLGPVNKDRQPGSEVPVLFDTTEPVVIPAGHFYIGNQRSDDAFDSRYFGLVEREQIKGIVSKL
jgi:type IV secretory pathway protease TraF